jgi:hypothetical protein
MGKTKNLGVSPCSNFKEEFRMSRTKGAKDKKPRKKETKVRDTFGYCLRYERQRNRTSWLLKGPINPKEAKNLRIKMLWRQLDCIRRTPDCKMVGQRLVHLIPPRSRVVLKKPVPAEEGRYARHWYRRRVSKLMVKLFGRDITKDTTFWEKLEQMNPEQRKFYNNVLRTAVCRMMEAKNEKLAKKRPFKTEQQIIEELRQLGQCVPNEVSNLLHKKYNGRLSL